MTSIKTAKDKMEAALTALGPRVHPAKALLKGRLAAAR